MIGQLGDSAMPATAHHAAPLSGNVSSPLGPTIFGLIIAGAMAPGVWFAAADMYHPATPRDDIARVAIQLVIMLALLAGGLAAVAWRHRVTMDGAAGTVTWTRRLFGVPLHRVTWTRAEMEAIEVRYSHLLHSSYLVGKRGRRALGIDQGGYPRARAWARALGLPYHEDLPKPDAPSRPITTRRFVWGLVWFTALIVAMFWIRQGKQAVWYALSFAIFWVLVAILLRYMDRFDKTPPQPIAYTRRWFDFLAGVWLLSVPFGPLFGWTATEFISAGNWQAMAGIRVFLSVVLPLLGVLGLVRFIRGQYAVPTALIALIGTAFPLVTAANTTWDFVRGPVWESVTVKTLRTLPDADFYFVDLADGRTLRTVADVPMKRGPARLLVLQGLDRVLRAHQ
jgi:hypothetical protein